MAKEKSKKSSRVVKRALVAGAIIIGLLLILLFLVFLNRPSKQTVDNQASNTIEDQEIKLKVLEGEASITREDKAIPVNSETDLEISDTVTTKANSKAIVIFADNSSITLDQNSSIKILETTIGEGKAETKVLQTGGNIWTRVKNLFGFETEFEVETDTVVASVRGTEFATDLRDGLKFVVEEHKVDFTLKDKQGNETENKIEVNEGEGVDLRPGIWEKILAGQNKLEKKNWRVRDFNSNW